MFLRTDQAGPARLAVTDRYGGSSPPPYDELNLAGHVGDDPAQVLSNRGLVAHHVGLPPDRLLFMDQVHGSRVAVVDGPLQPGEPPPRADALVTAAADVALVVVVADCAPVLLSSTAGGVVAVAHAGRRGMAGGIVTATLRAMQDLGADPAETSALVGPAICGSCYEVPASMQAEVAAVVPAARSTTRSGTPALDVRAGIASQLRAAGVGSVDVDPTCTAESQMLYSHRRDGVTGRFAGIAVRSDRAARA
jgi:polyphenol oxidase